LEVSDRPITDEEREELTAFLDGEADAAVRDKIEARLNQDPALRAEADAMRRTWELLDQLPRPEPAQDFTSRTLSRLSAVGSAPTITLGTPAFWHRVPWSRVAAVTLALAIGWFAATAWQRREPRPLRADDPVLVHDLRLIENLPLYVPVETLDYLSALDQPERFGTDTP
jgi:anti-sigma factor RsiW